MTMPPLADDLPDEALRVLATATRHETFFQERRMVWHAWGMGEPLILLHGGSGSWTHWLRNAEALAAQGRQVFAADLPGCGDSDPPSEGRGADADALVAPVASGIAQLTGGRAFDLVGFSFGSLVGGLIAADQPPPGLRGLVVVGAPALALGGRPVRLLEWRHLATRQERDAVHRGNLAALMMADEGAITPVVVALHAANLDRDRLRRRRLSQTDALEQALKRVACPLHAIYGSQDVLYRDRLLALEASLRSTPALASLRFIPGAGHWVQFEAPDAFLRALDDALK
ncbi:MAG TPA: alpha/beta hydrolase [Ramlibacter sp.]|nr:alpha/beta hydrolase [Ramlibacter sp.]